MSFEMLFNMLVQVLEIFSVLNNHVPLLLFYLLLPTVIFLLLANEETGI